MPLIQLTPSRVAGFALGVIVGTLVMVASAAAAEADTQVLTQESKQAFDSNDLAGWYSNSLPLSQVLDACDGPGMEAHKQVAKVLRDESLMVMRSIDAAVKAHGPAILGTVSVPDFRSSLLKVQAAVSVYASSLVGAGECNSKAVSDAAAAAKKFHAGVMRCATSNDTLPFDEVVICDGKPYLMPR